MSEISDVIFDRYFNVMRNEPKKTSKEVSVGSHDMKISNKRI